MTMEIRIVRSGDMSGITRVVLAARGFRGAELDKQMERDLARFRELGIVEAIESDTLVAHQGGRMVGVLRYGEFEGEVHLMRPDVDPVADAEDVVKAFLGQMWAHLGAQTRKAVFVDYPQPGAVPPTIGAWFLEAGFEKGVERADMRMRVTPSSAAKAGEKGLVFHPYEKAAEERFLAAFKRSFEGSLDPMMEWDAGHPEQSFEMFRTRFGEFHPNLWVLAEDEQGRDVGFALFQPFTGGRYAGDIVLLYMAVLPEARGRGYGEEIVREGLRRIVRWKQGAANVSLTVSEPNVPARRMYEKIGFRVVEEFTVYGGRIG